ncbi:MAG TPA: TIGR02679 domain-containing protein, partial [Polyangiales bacterium]
MPNEHERIARLLGGDALIELRGRLRRRFARLPQSPMLTLARLAPHERRALEGLLGRRTREADSLRVSIAELDHAVQRAGLAASFRHALELLDGPIADLMADRAANEHAWSSAFSQDLDPRLVGFLDSAASRGIVKRLAGGKPESAARLLESTSHVLARLPAPGWPRSQLAADRLGDAHALDQGRAVATLILATLRNDQDENDRDTWARAGVLVNELAAPALVLNLPAEPETPAGRLAQTARELGLPLHLSLR